MNLIVILAFVVVIMAVLSAYDYLSKLGEAKLIEARRIRNGFTSRPHPCDTKGVDHAQIPTENSE